MKYRWRYQDEELKEEVYAREKSLGVISVVNSS